MAKPPSLAEDKQLRVKYDEDILHARQRFTSTPDWGSDPMEILMAKQELEREMLELPRNFKVH